MRRSESTFFHIVLFYLYIYIYIHNRIKQCALPVTTIMVLWQLVNLGTRCTVTHCRIAIYIYIYIYCRKEKTQIRKETTFHDKLTPEDLMKRILTNNRYIYTIQFKI